MFDFLEGNYIKNKQTFDRFLFFTGYIPTIYNSMEIGDHILDQYTPGLGNCRTVLNIVSIPNKSNRKGCSCW